MAESVLDNFTVLDEVVQLVYQGSSRFVVLSHVKDNAWLLHAGLAREGRWWQGKWLENDVLHFVVRCLRSHDTTARAQFVTPPG